MLVLLILIHEITLQIGDVAKITKSCREIQISSENRTANLTLWGTIAEESCIEAESTYNIIAIKAENEFRGQLAFNSTPSTIFEVIVLLTLYIYIYNGYPYIYKEIKNFFY